MRREQEEALVWSRTQGGGAAGPGGRAEEMGPREGGPGV